MARSLRRTRICLERKGCLVSLFCTIWQKNLIKLCIVALCLCIFNSLLTVVSWLLWHWNPPYGNQWSTNLQFQDLQCGRAKETLRWLTQRNQVINDCSAFQWLHPGCRDRDSPPAKLTSAQSINKPSQGPIKLSLTLVVPTSRVTHLEFHQRFCTIQEHRWLLSGSSQHLRQTPTFAEVKGEQKWT